MWIFKGYYHHLVLGRFRSLKLIIKKRQLFIQESNVFFILFRLIISFLSFLYAYIYIHVSSLNVSATNPLIEKKKKKKEESERMRRLENACILIAPLRIYRDEYGKNSISQSSPCARSTD